jgi:hypothetical protein
MRLVTNSTHADKVRETTIGGEEHLVADDVPFVQPMELAGGYVPKNELQKSATEWEGVPLTLYHPTNDSGQIVSAATREGEEAAVGHLRNVRDKSDGTLVGNLAVSVPRANEVGGDAEEVLRKLREGEALDVSSQYFGEPLPSGNYDGEHRDEAEGNLTPDSVALIPNGEGVCSVPDGCGFGAKATANATANQETGDIVRWQSAGGTAYGRVVETIEDGAFDEEISGDVRVTAPAALIQVYRPSDEGGWSATDTLVAHKTNNDTLTVISSFPSDIPAANTADVDEAHAALRTPVADESVSPTTGQDEATGNRTEDRDVTEDTPTANILSEARTPEFDGTETNEEQSWGDVSKDFGDVIDALGVDAESTADLSDEVKETIAAHTLLGDPDADDWRNLFFFPVVNYETGQLNEGALNAVRGGRGEQADIPQDTYDSAEMRAAELLVENFEGYDEEDVMTGNEDDTLEDAVARAKEVLEGATANGDESGGNPDTGNPSRDELIEDIVANSEFKRRSVEAMGDNCVARLYNRVTGNEVAPPEERDADDADTEEDNDMTDDNGFTEQQKEELSEIIDETVEEKISANREKRRKEEKVDSIVANSNEFTDDDRDELMDTPEKALNQIEQSVTGGGVNVPSANSGEAVASDDELDEFDGGMF